MNRHVLPIVALSAAACSAQPARRVPAMVTDISPLVSRWHTDEVLVTFRSTDGLVGTRKVEAVRLRCRVGDTVDAVARGVSLALRDGACDR